MVIYIIIYMYLDDATLAGGFNGTHLVALFVSRTEALIQRGNAIYWLNANVRMCGPNVLLDSSLNKATHQLRCVVK